MNDAGMVEAFRLIPRTDSIRLTYQVSKLRKICTDDQTLEPFLSDSLEVLLRLFGATAGAFWFRPFNAATLCPVSRTGFDKLSLSSAKVSACEQFVRGAWQALEPQIRPITPPFVSLVSPIRDGQNSIGALQLLSSCETPLDEETTSIYARALSAISALLQPAIHRRMQVGSTSIRDAVDRLGQLADQLTGLRRSMQQAIDQTLSQLGGASFGSLEANQRFTRVMHELLESHGLRVVCPECGSAAILRCAKNPRATDGVFVFDHYLSGRRTFHGGTPTLPPLQVVTKPPRRGKSAAS